MTKLVSRLSLWGMVVLSVCWFLHTPIPDGFRRPWQVHMVYSGGKFAWHSAHLYEWLGIGPYYELVRFSWGIASELEDKLSFHGVQIHEETFDGVEVLVYSPPDVQEGALLPGMIYFHGGGWVSGSPETHGIFTRDLASQAGILVVSVRYRLAPEHPFPAGFEDSLIATKHFFRNAAKYGVDANRLIIAGDSAGGQLAAAVTLGMRDFAEKDLPSAKLQMLFYPMLQCVNFMTPSVQQNGHDPVIGDWILPKCCLKYAMGNEQHLLTARENDHVSADIIMALSDTHLDTSKLPEHVMNDDYLPWDTENVNDTVWEELKHVLMNPYFSPLIADDLSGLPKTYIFTADKDVLRDHGMWYAVRLREAGVDVTHRADPIAFHGVFNVHHLVDEAWDNTLEVITYIRQNV